MEMLIRTWGRRPPEGSVAEDPSGVRFMACRRRDDGSVDMWQMGEGSVVDVVAGLTVSAEESLVVPLPEVGSSPPVGSLVPVGLPVWFWVGNGEGVSESASVPGVSVTVRAEVTEMSVTVDGPADAGSVIACDGTGEVFDPGRHGPWDRSSCSHVFDHAGAAEVTVAVTWALSWSATTGASGVLDPVTRSTTVAMGPVELQAVVD
jgi:hypothetical protein